MRVLLLRVVNLGEVAWAKALWWGMRDKEARGGGVGGGGKAAEYFAHAQLPFSFFPCRLAPFSCPQADRHAFSLICVE